MYKKISLMSLATLVVVGVLALVNIAQAVVPPGVEGGDIYRVRNITKGTDFVDPVSAEPCDKLQYKVRIHNPGPDEVLKNVIVKAVFSNDASTQNVSSIIITGDNAQPSSTSDTATVNLSSAQHINYINGTTQLLDAQGNVISGLSDAITGSGVNIGDVGISVDKLRFVQFKAKVDCPEKPPEKPKYSCDLLEVDVDKKKRSVDAVVEATAENGAEIVQYRFDFGDSSDEVATENNSASHTYSSPGTYMIVAKVDVNVDGETKTAESEKCKAKVSFPEKPEKPPEQPPEEQPPTVVSAGPPSAPPAAPSVGPTALPDTGPGEVVAAAVFSITIASTAAYYVVVRRLSAI